MIDYIFYNNILFEIDIILDPYLKGTKWNLSNTYLP